VLGAGAVVSRDVDDRVVTKGVSARAKALTGSLMETRP
jgi:acetyltransferase-like isoleucine patch superfamily enzyme